jgi:fucose permease
VATEAAIYVWMPTLLADYKGSAAFLVAYSISIFFILRAAGRFIGAWMLERFYWTSVLALFSGLILACFVGTVFGGPGAAVYLLPASGLFMSVIYPSINSKGISCFPKSEHGAIAGVILFFTCVSAVVGPLAMGAVSDAMGHAKYGFALATGFAALLFVGLFFNWVFDPTRDHLSRLEATEY